MLAASPRASAFTIDPPIVVPNEQDIKQIMRRPSPDPGADKRYAPPENWSPSEDELMELGYRPEPGALEEVKPTPKPTPEEKKPDEKKGPDKGAEKKPDEPKAPSTAAPVAPPAVPGGSGTPAPGSAPTLDAPKLEMPKVPAAPGVQVGPGGI